MAAVQFAVQPQFGHLTLADTASVEEAVRIVMNARKRQEPAEKVVSKIAQQTGSTTVADLRRLTDTDWRILDVPAICRIYLKYLVRQAARATPLTASSSSSSSAVVPVRRESADPFMEQLQNDFNHGNPFDMSLYTHSLTMLASMGFKRDEAMEALCITENKSVEAALEVLFADLATRKRKRQDAVVRLGRQATVTNGIASPTSSSSSSSSSNNTEMISLRTQLDRERTSRIHAEVELKSYLDNLNRMGYREYILGLIADETINMQEFEQMKVYREKKKISQADHIQILQELGLTERSFEQMKKFETKRENECVICLDKPKNHVIMSCMHLCVCDDCVPILKNKKSCPMCSKKISNIIKIFI